MQAEEVKLRFSPVENDEKSLVQTPYRRQFLYIRHGRPPPRRCAVGCICGVINNSGSSRNLMITVTVQLISTRFVVYGSMLMTPTALHAPYRTVVPSATMHAHKTMQTAKLQRGCCWNCSSGWHAICLRYSYNIRPTFQLIQSVARVCQR